jgi:hypothetical protein
MRKGRQLSTLFIAFIAMISCLTAPSSALTESPYAEGEVLAVIDAPYTPAYSAMGVFNASAYSQAVSYQAEAFVSKFGLKAFKTYPKIAEFSGKSIIHIRSEHKSTEELIKELSSDPYVVYVHPNYIVKLTNVPNGPNDLLYPQLWGMKNIEMPNVWDHVTGSDSIVVAVLDSGIDYNHPDLKANMAKDSYGNYGRYFSGGKENGNPMDTDGHGTHIAGIIGAVGNNGIGVVGVNWRVKMLAVNVTPDMIEGGTISDVCSGIEYVK